MYIDVDELTTVARTKIRLTIVAESIADNVAMPVLMSSALSCIVALTSSVISEYVSLRCRWGSDIWTECGKVFW